jgi:uncharacterized protein involved in outer membrane biogenesis
MRLLFAILGSFFALALLVVVVFLALPAERLAQVALDRLAEETDREITIDAATRPTLWPDLMITVTGLEVGPDPPLCCGRRRLPCASAGARSLAAKARWTASN